jgi:uncharacterized membrane protein YphA (DoxX/SURF4 family)
MFPTGPAGAALWILRVSVAAKLFVEGTAHWTLVTSFWTFLGFAAVAMFLCLGLLTPYCATATCLIMLGVLLMAGGSNQFETFISILNSAALALLGPGAYSIDARIFGRRLLTVPPRR